MTKGCLQPAQILAARPRRGGPAQSGPDHHSLVDGELLAQGEVLQGQLAIATEEDGAEPQ